MLSSRRFDVLLIREAKTPIVACSFLAAQMAHSRFNWMTKGTFTDNTCHWATEWFLPFDVPLTIKCPNLTDIVHHNARVASSRLGRSLYKSWALLIERSFSRRIHMTIRLKQIVRSPIAITIKLDCIHILPQNKEGFWNEYCKEMNNILK